MLHVDCITNEEHEMNKTITVTQEEANTIAAILNTHAAMQDQGASNAVEIQARMRAENDVDTDMMVMLDEQVDDLELDAMNLRKLAGKFA
jgi:K+/H+ antiporter YhaU regulatory subunit KhtT